jgi:pilus assembly protein CpaC
MTNFKSALGTAFVALAVGMGSIAAPTAAEAQTFSATPSETLNLSNGTGTLVHLSSPMTDVFVANDKVADVQVRSASELYIFGKGSGETTVYATSKSGRVVYSATVRVGTNIGSLDEMLHMAMPEANIRATPMNGLVLLTGTVASPDDMEEAQRLAAAYLGKGTDILSRLRMATPLQVNLKVKFAEVSRSLIKQVGVNLLNRDSHSGHIIGIGQGNPGKFNIVNGPADPATGLKSESVQNVVFNNIAGGTTLGLFGHIFGTDLLGTLDLLENDGFVTTLAEPNLTALSGETASFLAGGEFPIPVSQGNQAVTIEYKQYGVSLAFTPIVLADGRISMRVRPEVSQLSDANGVNLGGFAIPSLTTRRAETTVELGSGQSFMLAGLLQNNGSNSIKKAPFLGDLPILGTLFRSNDFQRSETELVIIVTPYLVRPIDGQLALPTDGYRTPTDAQQVFLGQTYDGQSGRRAVPVTPGPAISGSSAAAAPGFKL